MNMKNNIAIIFAGLLIAGTIIWSHGAASAPQEASVKNVSIVDGVQIIAITAKGGYTPKITKAEANMRSELRITTRGTFDCSSALNIPSLNYHKNLPPEGETRIEIPPQKAGTTLSGICAMGMYHFAVQF